MAGESDTDAIANMDRAHFIHVRQCPKSRCDTHMIVSLLIRMEQLPFSLSGHEWVSAPDKDEVTLCAVAFSRIGSRNEESRVCHDTIRQLCLVA